MNDTSRYSYKEISDNYDEEVIAYSSFAHNIIFGMCYEFITPKETLLDIGIGTGLASENFSKAGLKIFGLDNSKEMLGACQAKGFPESLVECDIANAPYPYIDDFFNHVICCGVLHFFGDLSKVVSEIERVLVSGGTFSFSLAPTDMTDDYIKESTEWGVPIYKHSNQYIQKVLAAYNMEFLKEQRLLIKGADKINYNMQFSVIVCKCNK